jgi:hypothetical protein
MPHSKETYVHLTARTRSGCPSLCGPQTGPWLWKKLRAAFPQALSTGLMPDHPHVVTPCSDPKEARRRFAHRLAHFTRQFGNGMPLFLTAEPTVIRGAAMLRRAVRYVALNPCRARLVDDPLSWVYSTHRDVVGAVVDPWVDADRLSAALGMPRTDFERRHHQYVSADPSVRVDGTAFPLPAPRRVAPTVPLQDIAEAAASATRRQADEICRPGPTRTLFVLVALSQGWTHFGQLAAACACSVRTIRRVAEVVQPGLLEAGLLCLGDARLRVATPDRLLAAG